MNSNLQNAKLEPLWHTNKIVTALIFFLVAALLFFPFINPSNFQLHLMIMIFMYAVMAQSWNVIAGFSGQISLGHVIFFGIGGYTSSFFLCRVWHFSLDRNHHRNFIFFSSCHSNWNSDVKTFWTLFCYCHTVNWI